MLTSDEKRTLQRNGQDGLMATKINIKIKVKNKKINCYNCGGSGHIKINLQTTEKIRKWIIKTTEIDQTLFISEVMNTDSLIANSAPTEHVK